MGWGFRVGALSAIGCALVSGCDSRAPAPPAAPERPSSGAADRTGEAESALSPPGALIRLEMDSKVGVLLDEIPPGLTREIAATEAILGSRSDWRERAARQVRLTYYRLVYRGEYYPSDPPRGPLPLPPDVSKWRLQLVGVPHRVKKDGHDAVVMNYRFETYLVSDTASPGLVEPALAEVGGRWTEDFQLPLDPDSLVERTGYACMDEMEYPPNSVFEANPHYFYDDTCEVETPDTSACHVTDFPAESCADALAAHAGRVATAMRFSRIPYRKAIADLVRTGAVTNESGADLAVIAGDLDRERAFVHRYFDPASCEMEEGVIGSPGWRRLLTFSASIQNAGAQAIDMGDVLDPASPWRQSHVFDYSECHHHFHFSHYGVFGYGAAQGAKRAFCLEDTNRYRNDERTSLVPLHQSCRYQGVTPGWGDEYQLGIPGQWVDVTGVDTTSPQSLSFDLNADQFLCEGLPELDATGHLAFDPSPFVDASGNAVSRLRCAFAPGWDANNHAEATVQSLGGNFVTEPCTRGEIGPLRSCGFDLSPTLSTCEVSGAVSLHCTATGAPQVLRVCERSAVLGSGIPCTAREASLNTIVPISGLDVVFDCPEVRDAPGTGGYAIYRAPLLPSHPLGTVACVAQ